MKQKLDKMGAYFNGCTFKEFVEIKITASHKHFSECADIMSKVFEAIDIPAKEYCAEIKRIKAEIREEDEKKSIDYMGQKTVWKDTCLSKSIAGKKSVISGLSLMRIREYAEEICTPNNMFIYVTGAVNHNDIKEFTTESVSGTIQRGGTILRTARSKDFLTPEGRAKAYENIKANGIDALIVIGGNGSLAGAQELAQEYDLPCIGLPGTIDNDLYGTDTTIGYDTALNTIMECVDKIRDTANSHNRIFFVEVMGRDAGFLAQNAAIATGAEAAIIPEDRTDVDQLATFIGRGVRKSKNSSIVLVSESKKDGTGGAQYYAERLVHEYPEFEARVTILGHLQRGGIPTANDRILASRLGVAAIEALKDGQRNVMVGVKHDQIVYVPFNKAIRIDKPIDRELINVLNVLSI
jgi:6-phosphofructokinase 1